MNFMPAADSRVFMFGHVDVYEIELRKELSFVRDGIVTSGFGLQLWEKTTVALLNVIIIVVGSVNSGKR